MGTPITERPPRLGDVVSTKNRILFFNRNPQTEGGKPRVSRELIFNEDRVRTIVIQDISSNLGKTKTIESITDKSISGEGLVLQMTTKEVETDSYASPKKRTVLKETIDRFADGKLSIKEERTHLEGKDYFSVKTFYDELTGEVLARLNREFDFIGLADRHLMIGKNSFYDGRQRDEIVNHPDFSKLTQEQQEELLINMKGVIYERFKDSMFIKQSKNLEELLAQSVSRHDSRPRSARVKRRTGQ